MNNKHINNLRIQEDDAFRKAADLWLEREIKELESRPVTPEEDAYIRCAFQHILPLENSKSTKRIRRLPKTLTIVACITFVLFVSLSAALAVSEPFRSLISGLVIQKESTNTEYRDLLLVPDGWSGIYFPAFIPDGYSCVYLDHSNRAVIFRGEDEKFFQFVEYRPTDTVKVDTEDAIEETIYIWGASATLIRNEDMIYIIWDNKNRLFLINGNIEDYIAVQIAESISLVG